MASKKNKLEAAVEANGLGRFNLGAAAPTTAATSTEEEKVETRGRKRSGTQEGELIKATFSVDADLMAKVRIIAKNEGLTQKEMLEKCFLKIIEGYEKKYGEISLKDRKTFMDDIL